MRMKERREPLFFYTDYRANGVEKGANISKNRGDSGEKYEKNAWIRRNCIIIVKKEENDFNPSYSKWRNKWKKIKYLDQKN